MKTALKIFLWTLMALILAISGILICTVKMLTPDKLTPLTERVAGKFLNADLSLGRVELAFEPAFPILRLKVDSLTLVSRAFDTLPDSTRRTLPVYADTLLRFDHLSGAVALDRLASRGEIALRDVRLRGPELNIVLASDSVYNYDIVPPSAEADTADTAYGVIPPFSIDIFSIEEPRAIRFYNAVDSTDATIVLLSDAALNGTEAPEYSLGIEGNINSPLMRGMTGRERLRFGAGGRLHWDPQQPTSLAMEEFAVRGDFFRAVVDADVDFGKDLTVRTATVALDPVSLDSLLTFVPADIRRKNRLSAPYFTTNATVRAAVSLTAPFNLTTDSIPAAKISLAIPATRLKYGKLDLRKFALDMEVNTEVNNLDAAKVEIRNFEAAGPATAIALEARLKHLVSDPEFDACLKAKCDISRLPAIVANLAEGYLAGNIDADVDLRGRASMFSPKDFHKLDVAGRLTARDFFYLRNDTAMMVQVEKAGVKFGSQVSFRDTTGRSGSPTLAAALSVDTANVLVSGIGMGFKDFSLGVGVENSGTAFSGDTTLVVPLGGGMKVGKFNLRSVSDSAGVNLSNLSGHVGIKRYKGRNHRPEFNFNLRAERLAAGAPAARVMLRDAEIKVNAHKLGRRRGRISPEVKRSADSIARVHPELSPDSVYRLAIAKRRHRPGEPVHHRVHKGYTEEENEIIEWGTSTALRKLLLTWDISGSISTRRARMFTPTFPLRNRISNLDISFNTDSITLRDLRYKAGHSDLLVNGIISNLRRSFTSGGYRSPLKINFDISSRMIDVNEIAAAVFAGAAYSEKMRRGEGGMDSGFNDLDGNEESFDRSADSISAAHTAPAPILLPVNIDARLAVSADSILYSDLRLDRFSGEVLLYDGALNLNNLRGTSDFGSLTLDALYNAPTAKDMQFGFGLDVDRFDIGRFLNLVPAIDSVMPLMRDFKGYISAEMAATVDLDSAMNFELPTLNAAVHLSGDSLQFIDSETYRTIGKWLRFKDRTSNIVKTLNVDLTVRDNMLELYPFVINIDRYELGVQGYNDLALNFNYHLAVLKSPIPFKFGITVKGNPDDYKVRFGGAKFKEGSPAASVAMVDTARVNLISQIQSVFRRGVSRSRFARIDFGNGPQAVREMQATENGLSASDSLALIREGLIEAPAETQEQSSDASKTASKSKKNRKNRGSSSKAEGTLKEEEQK